MSTMTDDAQRIEKSVWSDEDLRKNPHLDDEKASKVREMFGAIAHRYDLNNRVHSFGRDQAWRRTAVREAQLRQGDVVLDVACGTGDLSRAFARAGARHVVGADFTPQMLEIARRRRAIRGGEIEYVEADAQALPFEDHSFDVVSIAFGIRNVTAPDLALAEFYRVLRPGGRLVILEFARPRSALIARVNDFYGSVIMPRTATWLSRDESGAYHYLPRSINTFLDRAEMVDRITRAGFAAVTQRAMTFGVCVCYRGVRTSG